MRTPGSNTLTTVAKEEIFVTKFNCSLTGIEAINESSSTKIFPNPNNGSFKLQIDNEISEGELILYNSIGQKVHEQKILQGINDINTNGISEGLYHYTLLQNKQLLNNGKIAIFTE
jgi:hypothetical protein